MTTVEEALEAAEELAGVDWLDVERAWMSHMPAPYANLTIALCSASGLAADSMNIILILIMCAVFGHFWQKLRSPTVRQLTAFIFSLVMLFTAFGGGGSLVVIGYLVVGYPIVKARNTTNTLAYAWIGLLSVFFYYWWYFYHSFRMDVSGTFMGFMCRFSFLAWDQYDMDNYKKGEKLSDDPKILAYRMEHKLDKELTFYDYMCYMMFFIHLFCGSNMTTMDYFKLVDLRVYKEAGYDPVKDDLPTPAPLMIVAVAMESLIHAILYVVLTSYFNPEYLMESSMNPLFCSWYIALMTLCVKQRYHFIWYLLHVSLLTSGAAFDGKKGEDKIKWRNHWNIYSYQAEFAEKSTYLTFNWNMTVNIWLKYYFLDRLTFGSFQVKLLLTRAAASAFHGMHSGYHLFFGMSVFHSLFIDAFNDWLFGGMSKDYIKNGKPELAPFVKFGRTFITWWILNGYGNALVWHHSTDYLAQNNKQLWIPHILCFAAIPFKALVVDPWKKKLKKTKKKVEMVAPKYEKLADWAPPQATQGAKPATKKDL